MQLKLIVTALVSLIIALNDSAWSATPEAQWIWQGPPAEGQKLWFRKHFTLDTPAKAARIAATCDNQFTLFVNGQRTLGSQNWEQVASADISKLLRAGENVIAVEARNKDGIAGFLGSLKIIDGNGMEKTIVSDRSWRATNKLKQDWHLAAFDDHDWRPAEELGVVGLQALPWSAFIDARSLLDVSAPESVRPKTAKNVTIGPPGFKVELVYEVPKGQGSWVSITNDDRGRLIVSDQQGAGLYLITPAQIGDAAAESTIQKLPVKLSGAQGLLYAFDSLYVMTHAGKRGIHRAKDTDGDGLLDSSEFIMPVSGDGEHGPHALILTPDKKSILVAAGNHTRLPSQVTASRIPMNWGEDLLLPRHWDVSGHAAGVLAPGGWICKIDPTGKQCEVMSIGYRNQYDMALNADGELFTFDADMEYDFGSPWYRPTRVCHATSGSEFGWRSGTGKWPSYYEDSIPSAVDIGPGSPVGITFGYGAKFPAKYQKALFLLDWTYSTIYAAHLTPDGASYRGEVEDFMHGEPMQVTDAVVNSDGALYFTVGGRGTQSALYRVVYAGDESTAPVDATDKQGAELRVLRKQLEEFHRPGKADLNLIWANLGHEDRFIRYAARIALEHQPLDAWRTKIATETNWRTAITALMALARQGKADDLEPLLAALDKLDWKKLSEQEQLAAARTYALAFIRLGKPSTEWQQKLITRFEEVFPGPAQKVNAELVQLLVYLDSPTIVAKALDHMEQLPPEAKPTWNDVFARSQRYGGTVQAMLENMPPTSKVLYAFALRNAKSGWTPELRRRYFQFLAEAASYPGGASYPGFLKFTRDDAVENIPINERVQYDDLLSQPLGAPPFVSKPPKGPGRKWTQEEALAEIKTPLRGRNFASGRNLFHAASCAKCHRLAGEGGAIGPDLSTAGRKFSLPDMLDAILEPSKAISDQYGSYLVLTEDGEQLNGRLVEVGDDYFVYTQDPDAKPRQFKKDEVQVKPSTISQMPVGLVDALNEEELKDLIAYIQAAGNKKAAQFRK